MEPLSVAASIVGLLTATAKVCSFVKSVNRATSLRQNVLSELSDIRMSLVQLRTVLCGPEAEFRSQASLLIKEDIGVVLGRLLMTLSELANVMKLLKQYESLRVVSRVKLAMREPNISRLLLRLQSSRVSVSLMVTTLTW